MVAKLSRRVFLSSACVSALFVSTPSQAWFHGVSVPIGKGWNVLPLGCGGLVTGMFIANDGSMVCRTDVGNGYRFSGLTTDYANPSKVWVPLLNYTSLAGQGPSGGNPVAADKPGMWEHVLGPNNSNVHVAVFADMTGGIAAGKSWIWYSSNSGTSWSKSNASFTNYTAGSNEGMKFAQQKIAVDPANPNVAYCGMPLNSGNSAGAYTSLNKAGGSSLGIWTSVKISGATPIPATASCTYMPSINTSISAGIAIDPTSGTTTLGGQTVTNRIIIPIAGSGIYESTDGGNSFTEVAASAMGSADFYVTGGGFTAEGIYYCVVTSTTIGGIWRYKSGTWTKIAGGAAGTYAASSFYQGNVFLIIDPRNNPTSKAYLSIFGPNGIGTGYTSSNANTGSPPTWTGATSGQNSQLKSTSYDLGYINYIFGQGAGAFTFGCGAVVDANGICWWPGNQSLFYMATSNSNPNTPTGPPTYANSSNSIVAWSMGRGMEATVAEDALCPPGGTYPVMAVQDLGAPLRGTFVSYPDDIYARFVEYTCESVEYAASDSRIVVARVTDQGASFADVSGYSPNYGASGSWVRFAGNPTALWQAQITATIASTTLTVSAVASGTIFPYAQITGTSLGGGAYYGRVQPYGTGGTTGTGGVGTYILDTSSTLASPTTVYSVTPIQGGQTVAVDIDHYLTCPAGLASITLGQWVIPAYTTNRGATWQLCNGLPEGGYVSRPWSFGPCLKPFAVGYGADLNTVWAALRKDTTLTLYRSTDKGANFNSIASWTVSVSCEGIYCLSVPGKPGELWISGSFTNNGGVWHITNANTASATVTAVNMPSTIATPTLFTLGAGAPGAYPFLYLRGFNSGGDSIRRLYQGSYSGSGATVTWSLYGPTGLQGDLPNTCQLQGFQSIRGDWNTPGRLYAPTAGCGLAYYNP